jgi:UDP-N-acetylmuramate dehydrogenase
MLFRLLAIPNLQLFVNASLARYTRFEIGGPARALADARTDQALIDVLGVVQSSSWRHTIIGGGTNLIVDDDGFDGLVVRYTAPAIDIDGLVVRVQAGAVLQDLVDRTIDHGLRGLETMTGIPGWVGGAVYGNAGAYGHSIHERVETVRFFDGKEVREIDNAACEFRYRESVFKQRKEWVILSTTLRLDRAESSDLRTIAQGIRKIRDEKYPPTMRCAGSIFKNLLLDELPEHVRKQVPERVIREGKVPSAYFLEEAGAKGMARDGVRVADYHANLIYNAGEGTARQLREIIGELKRRVRERFGLDLQEEVQYVGP